MGWGVGEGEEASGCKADKAESRVASSPSDSSSDGGAYALPLLPSLTLFSVNCGWLELLDEQHRI